MSIPSRSDIRFNDAILIYLDVDIHTLPDPYVSVIAALYQDTNTLIPLT